MSKRRRGDREKCRTAGMGVGEQSQANANPVGMLRKARKRKDVRRRDRIISPGIQVELQRNDRDLREMCGVASGQCGRL